MSRSRRKAGPISRQGGRRGVTLIEGILYLSLAAGMLAFVAQIARDQSERTREKAAAADLALMLAAAQGYAASFYGALVADTFAAAPDPDAPLLATVTDLSMLADAGFLGAPYLNQPLEVGATARNAFGQEYALLIRGVDRRAADPRPTLARGAVDADGDGQIDAIWRNGVAGDGELELDVLLVTYNSDAARPTVALPQVFDEAAQQRASDIHIRVLPTHAEVKIRVNGRMRPMGSIAPEIGQAMIRAAFAVASGQGATGTDSTFQQGALGARSGLLPPTVEMVRLQYSPTSEQRGALVMRLKYIGTSSDIDVDALGYAPEQVADLRNMRLKTNGMYIFAGKVSSGKTTTLQRCLNAMYAEKRGEITIYAAEDPKELELDGAIQAQISAGLDAVEAFRTAMKAALRSDPNVIVLGEIRAPELAEMALEAAKTGHALWSTVHAGSALGILNRLINLGVDREDLKDPRTVGGLIYQRLVGVICPDCRVDFPRAVADGLLEGELAVRFARLSGQRLTDLHVRGPGCARCQSGLVGRTVVAETIRPDAALLEIYMDRSRLEAEKYWLLPREKGGLGGVPVLHHALAKVGAAIADINETQEEVDLLETYEREFAHLTDRLRHDISVLRQGAPTRGFGRG